MAGGNACREVCTAVGEAMLSSVEIIDADAFVLFVAGALLEAPLQARRDRSSGAGATSHAGNPQVAISSLMQQSRGWVDLGREGLHGLPRQGAGELLVAAGWRCADGGVGAGLHRSATFPEAEEGEQPGRDIVQPAPAAALGALLYERLHALRGELSQGRGMLVEAEELDRAQGGAAMLAHCRGSGTLHLPEQIEIGTDEESAATRIRNGRNPGAASQRARPSR